MAFKQIDTRKVGFYPGRELGLVDTTGMRPYQLNKTTQLVQNRQRSLLILKYGAGKAWCILAAANKCHSEMVNYQAYSSAIILCKNRNVANWETEIRKRNVKADIRTIQTEDWTRITVNTYIIVPHHLVEKNMFLLERVIDIAGPAALICDESTKIKNPNTKRTKACLELAHYHRSNLPNCRQFAMTGKATPEGPHEIWSQFDFIGASRLIGTTYYGMINKYFLMTDRGPGLKADTKQEFYDRCSSAICRLSQKEWAEYKKLYNITTLMSTEFFEESKEQIKLIKDLEDNWRIEHPDGELTEYVYTIQIHGKAQQIANGFYKKDENTVVVLKENPKLQLLIETLEDLLEENPTRSILVWCHYHEDYRIVSEALVASKITFVIGPDEEKIKVFEAKKVSVILMPVTVSEGHNGLAVADTDVYWSNVYSIETREQAEGRLDRANQLSDTINHIDLCGTNSYDRKVVDSLQMKRPIPKDLT